MAAVTSISWVEGPLNPATATNKQIAAAYQALQAGLPRETRVQPGKGYSTVGIPAYVVLVDRIFRMFPEDDTYDRAVGVNLGYAVRDYSAHRNDDGTYAASSANRGGMPMMEARKEKMEEEIRKLFVIARLRSVTQGPIMTSAAHAASFFNAYKGTIGRGNGHDLTDEWNDLQLGTDKLFAKGRVNGWWLILLRNTVGAAIADGNMRKASFMLQMLYAAVRAASHDIANIQSYAENGRVLATATRYVIAETEQRLHELIDRRQQLESERAAAKKIGDEERVDEITAQLKELSPASPKDIEILRDSYRPLLRHIDDYLETSLDNLSACNSAWQKTNESLRILMGEVGAEVVHGVRERQGTAAAEAVKDTLTTRAVRGFENLQTCQDVLIKLGVLVAEITNDVYFGRGGAAAVVDRARGADVVKHIEASMRL